MAFVVDASMLAAWLLPDETTPQTDAILDRLDVDQAIAPDLLWHEARNLILNSVRRGRASPGFIDWAIPKLTSLPILDAGPGEARPIVDLARARELSAYDAAYLWLAKTEGAALATLDRKLRAAATAEGIALLPDMIAAA